MKKLLLDVKSHYGDRDPLWYEIKLPKKYINYLWEIVDESEKEKLEEIEKQKGALVGNISTSFELKDKNNFFAKAILHGCIKKWITEHNGHPCSNIIYSLDNPFKAELSSFWGNYQYKGEFNPMHHHSGMYSFVIWLKIPYNRKDEFELPWLNGVKPQDRKAGCFEFNYTSHHMARGTAVYPLDKKFEGTMLFFPSWLQHQVYPFYTSDEKRVSLSGNIIIK